VARWDGPLESCLMKRRPKAKHSRTPCAWTVGEVSSCRKLRERDSKSALALRFRHPDGGQETSEVTGARWVRVI
jgi:hypothetical protein